MLTSPTMSTWTRSTQAVVVPTRSPFRACTPRHESATGVASITFEVDGELFALRPDEHGGTDYTWLTGPNNGYGFGTSPTPNWSTEAHRENIRSFPAQIDPSTGYIEDD